MVIKIFHWDVERYFTLNILQLIETLQILNDYFVQSIQRVNLQRHNDWMNVKQENMKTQLFFKMWCPGRPSFICSNIDFRTFYVGLAIAYITVYAFDGFYYSFIIYAAWSSRDTFNCRWSWMRGYIPAH